MTGRRTAGERDRAHDGGTTKVVVAVGAHSILASALVVSLRVGGFPSAASVHPDALPQGGADAAGGVRPGDTVVLGVLHDDGPVGTSSIGPLVRLGCRVVVLTSGDPRRLQDECLRLGADAVVGDGMPFDRLVETLLTVLPGGSVLASGERRAVIAATTGRLSGVEERARRFSTLTPREAEVLKALVEGHSPKGIALAAGISISTVRGHIQRVLSKLDVSSQREAFAMARRVGWPHSHAA